MPAASQFQRPPLETKKRVLLIANDFPPIGGGGVQRPFYFAKWLGEFGWQPLVLTVKDVAYRTKDPTLLDELPATARVLRTESLELRRLLWLAHRLVARRNRAAAGPAAAQAAVGADVRSVHRDLARGIRRWLFVPDDRLLWAPFAVPRGIHAIKKYGASAILATVPCYSSGVIGQLLSRFTGLPLVLDLRDPWTQDPYLPSPTPLHAWLNKKLEASTVARAARVVVISEEMRKRFCSAYPGMPRQKLVTITNGYDAEELASAAPVDTGGKFVVVYSGSLFAHHRLAFRAFCRAWSELAARDPQFASAAELWLVGKSDPEIRDELAAWPAVKTTTSGYRPHAEALRHLRSASALLLLIKNLDPERDLVTIPGKLFEYLGCGSPILMIGPEGDAADIVRSAGGLVHREQDLKRITAGLNNLYKRYLSGARPAVAKEVATRYDRKNIAGRLAAELDRLVD